MKKCGVVVMAPQSPVLGRQRWEGLWGSSASLAKSGASRYGEEAYIKEKEKEKKMENDYGRPPMLMLSLHMHAHACAYVHTLVHMHT